MNPQVAPFHHAPTGTWSYLAWDPATDQLTATGTVGQKFFERFFQNFKADLIEQYGPGVYRQEVEGSVVAVPLSAYSKAVPAC